MRKRTSSSPTPRKYKRGRNDNAGFYQDLHKRACDSFKLRLIDEVAKYPILKSESQENTESCYDAWVQIANSIEEDWDVTSTTVMDLIEYCRQTWKNLKRAYSRSEKGETSGLGRVIQPMRALFAEIDKTGAEENKSNNSSDENNGSNNSSDENNESNNSSDENNESNDSSDEDNESNDSLYIESSHSSDKKKNESNNSPEVGKRKSLRWPSDEFKLKLIAEVKKHPSLYESLEDYTRIDAVKHTQAWEEITEALQADEEMSPRGKKYCITNWRNIRNEFLLYLHGFNTRGTVIRAMEDLFPDYVRVEFKNKNASNKKRRQSVRSAVGANHFCSLEGLPSDELQTGAPATESSPPNAVENNAMNNSSEVGSDAAEDIVRPATNHVPVVPSIPQPAATRGNPRSTGAGSTERAASLAIVDHLFDSLRSPAGKTHICNMLIQVVYTYRPDVLSDIIKYATRQPQLFNIDWSGLPIPEDLCREMFRRDAEEKLRKVYDEISSSKKPGKKGN